MKHAVAALALLLVAAPVLADPPARTQRIAQTRRQPPRRNPPRPTQTQPAQPAQPAQTQPAQPAQTPPASPNGALTADQVAQRIQDFYDRTTDFQADITQQSRNRLIGTETRTGRVVFRKPGRMRWSYANGDLIVSDGRTLWAYQHEDRQAIRQNLQQSQMPTALAFLTGVGRLTDSFTFRLLDPGQYNYPTGYVLELRPTTPQPTYERIVFYVDRASFQVVRTAVIDAQGNTNRFDFANPRVNMNVPLPTFDWSPPPGVSVVTP